MSSLRRRILAAAGGLLVASLALAGCGGSGGSTGSSDNLLFKMGSGSTIDSLNPFVAFNQLAYNTFFYTYPYLVQYAPDLTFKGYFATKWVQSSDGKTWTFTVPADAKWTDGETLNADDVAWTYNTLLKYKDGGAGNWAGTIANLKSVKATDASTVVFTYSKPVANVLSQLEQVPILPEQFWSKYTGGKDGANLKSAKVVPPIISGGPFQVVGYQKDAIVQFKANPDYYGTKPHIGGFAVKMYTNSDSMVTDLKNGTIDFVDAPPAAQMQPLKDAGFQVSDVPGVEWHDVIINSSPNKKDHPELQNLKVREAFEYAVDRKRLIATIEDGAAEAGAAIVPPATNTPDTPWSDPSLKPLPFDPDKANQMLDDLGYKKGSNGIRVANGVPMSYQMIIPSSLDKATAIFQILQDGFKQIGVDLNVKLLDASAAFSAITAPDNTYAEFDLAYWDWVPLIDPDFILSVLTCEQYGGWSDTGYCNKKYDQLYAKQATQTDPQARLQTVYQMQQMIHQDRPYIVIGYDDAINATAPGWTGLVASPQGQFNALSTDSLVNVNKS